jgi:hypothetical protein
VGERRRPARVRLAPVKEPLAEAQHEGTVTRETLAPHPVEERLTRSDDHGVRFRSGWYAGVLEELVGMQTAWVRREKKAEAAAAQARQRVQLQVSVRWWKHQRAFKATTSTACA